MIEHGHAHRMNDKGEISGVEVHIAKTSRGLKDYIAQLQTRNERPRMKVIGGSKTERASRQAG